MKRIKIFGSRQPVWLEINRGAGLQERLSTAVTDPASPSSEAAPQESNVELFRGRIQLGNGNRRVNAYVFDPPHELIEVHAEQGCGALTTAEGEALSKWLHQRVLERLPAKPGGWFRWLLTRSRG
jgi:hypothetical protein